MGIMGVLFVLTIAALTLIITHDVHAITRADIFYLKDEIDNLKEKIAAYTESIRLQVERVADRERIIDDLKEAERIAREWDRFTDTAETRKELEKAQKNLEDAKKKYIDSNSELQRLINLKNDAAKTLDELKSRLTNDETALKKKNGDSLKGLTKMIGVDISKACKTMIIHNYTTTCPSYEDLLSLDNSKPETGQFGIHDGFFQRGDPLLKNVHRLYDFESDFVIVVDPPYSLANRIKMITIENSLDTYLLASDHTKKDHTRTVNHDRYVDSCQNSVITSKDWKHLLPDTIHYLRTGCTVTGFDSLETIEDEKTEIDITTSRHYQYTKWLDGTKQNCKGLCFEY